MELTRSKEQKTILRSKSKSNNQQHFLRLTPIGDSLAYLVRVQQVQAHDARLGWDGQEYQTQRVILQGLTGSHQGKRPEPEADRLANHRAYSTLKERNSQYFCPVRFNICTRPPSPFPHFLLYRMEVSVIHILLLPHHLILGKRGLLPSLLRAHGKAKRHVALDRVCMAAGWGQHSPPLPMSPCGGGLHSSSLAVAPPPHSHFLGRRSDSCDCWVWKEKVERQSLDPPRKSPPVAEGTRSSLLTAARMLVMFQGNLCWGAKSLPNSELQFGEGSS